MQHVVEAAASVAGRGGSVGLSDEQPFPLHEQGDAAPQLGHQADADPPGHQPVALLEAEPAPTFLEPAAEPAAQPRDQRGRSSQQSGHLPGTVGVLGHLDVVDLADHAAVAVDHLAVHQVQHRVERVTGADVVGTHQAPILVQIIRGMAATAATPMSTR